MPNENSLGLWLGFIVGLGWGILTGLKLHITSYSLDWIGREIENVSRYLVHGRWKLKVALFLTVGARPSRVTVSQHTTQHTPYIPQNRWNQSGAKSQAAPYSIRSSVASPDPRLWVAVRGKLLQRLKAIFPVLAENDAEYILCCQATHIDQLC